MTTANPYDNITFLVNYIEENIHSQLTLEHLSTISYISKFHLSRLFKNLTDNTLMDYVKGRKLACSLHDLLNTDLKIIDISLKYGFKHEQTYIRAFKKAYDITPSKYRRQHQPVKIIDKVNLERSKILKTGIIFEAEIVVKPSIKLIGYKKKINVQENFDKNVSSHHALDFFYNYSRKIKNAVNPNVFIGLTRQIPESGKKYTYYMPALQVTDFSEVPEGLTCDTLPSSTYAVFKYCGTHPVEEISMATLRSLYDYVLNDWADHVGYKLLDYNKYHFEEIDSSAATKDYCEAKIYMPIQDF